MGDLIGILGGTFDPPHNAHVSLAEEAQVHLGLERVFWVVTGKPPHKPDGPVASVEDRVAMVEAIIRGTTGFELSRADLDREPPHYSYGTVEWLRERFPSKRWAYLMGADSLRDLPTWVDPARFLKACDLIGVIRRPGVTVDLDALEGHLKGIREKVRFIPSGTYAISGREIRRRIRDGESADDLLPAAVLEYIRAHHLYRSTS
jgi:nicotinate-nucleotide adenylyltransferase